MLTLQSLFNDSMQKYSSEPLITLPGDQITLTYSDAAEVVARIMLRLTMQKLSNGDRILVYSALHIEQLALFWAAANLGIIVVPIDYTWPKAILQKLLDDVLPQIIFCDCKRLPELTAILTQNLPVVVFDDVAGNLPLDCLAISFLAWLDENSLDSLPRVDAPKIRPEDIATILYTSGSTGMPKGVVLSHEALYRSGLLYRDTFQLMSQDRLLILSEFYTITGVRNFCVSALLTGYSYLLIPNDDRTIFSIVESIAKYGCTLLVGTPTLVRQLLQFQDRIDRAALRTIRCIICAGSMLNPETIDVFFQTFHIPIFNNYGLTETAGLCIATSWDNWAKAQGSIGVARGCKLEIVDADGNCATSGEPGEIRIQTQAMMLGYYHNPTLTAQVIRNGWFYTGDLAIMNADGYIVLKGRKRNIIKNAYGDLVQLEEVERILTSHSLVAEASVLGYMEASGQEGMAAFIVTKIKPNQPDHFVQELREFITQHAGIGKLPDLFFLKDKLPRNAAGKVIREELRKEISV